MTCIKSYFAPVTLFALSFLLAAGAAADWWQLQGPNRDGTSPETGLLRSWPEEGPRELWSFALGEGFAGPAVRGDAVYLLDRIDGKQDILRCIDLNTGEERWTYAYDAPGRVGYDGSRTPPTVGEKHIFTVGMLGDFHCIDLETRQPVWRKNLLEDFGSETPRWGISQAPYLWRDLVIVAPQHKDAFVVAYRQLTGELVWKSPSFGGAGYSSPVVHTLAGVEQAVMLSAHGKAAGISLENGEILWTYGGWDCRIPIPYPKSLPDDRLFITGGYDAGSAMIRIAREDGAFIVTELFKTDDCGSQVHQPLLHEGYLYAHSNANRQKDGMICMTLDGELKWRTRDTRGLPMFDLGNLLLADGMIISLDGRTGILHLVEPSPEGYRELAQAKIFDGNQIWAPMALTQGKLLLRNQKLLKCLDLRAP